MPETLDFAPFMNSRFELQGTRWDTDDADAVATATAFAAARWKETPVYISASPHANCDFRGIIIIHYKGCHTHGTWYLAQYSKSDTQAYNVIARSRDASTDPTIQDNAEPSTWEIQNRELLKGRRVQPVEKMADAVHFSAETHWVPNTIALEKFKSRP